MSTAARLHLKQPSGWFAAGRQVEHALTLLSDAAFKLFVWLCLYAERSRGSICVEPAELAAALGRTEDEIRAHLEELFHQEVCVYPKPGVIEITDRFWPYERLRECGPGQDLAAYVNQVKSRFLERRCVRSTFTPADEKLAIQLYQKGVSIIEIERAILLGSLRKYAALLNNSRGTPITTLYYFTALFDEVRQQISTDYWNYVARKVRTLEQRWQAAAETK